MDCEVDWEEGGHEGGELGAGEDAEGDDAAYEGVEEGCAEEEAIADDVVRGGGEEAHFESCEVLVVRIGRKMLRDERNSVLERYL